MTAPTCLPSTVLAVKVFASWPLVVWALLVLAIGLAFVRLALGPSLADRAVVLDLLATLSQGVLAVYAVVTGEPALLDVAIAIALLSFLGTIAFARYIEREAAGREVPSE